MAVEHLQDLVRMSEEMAKEKANFLRILVHELKSPVSATKMMADLLSCYPAENPKVAAIPKKISARMDQLLDLIRGILELAKLKLGEPLGEIKVLNLVEETVKACEPYRIQAEEKGLDMTIECENQMLPVRFDMQGYSMLVSNLVSNAVKYTLKGAVRIVLKHQDSDAILEVSDTGMGIPESEMPQLFTEFFRGSNVKRQQIQGTGVGLAGVKELVERFGGELDAQSREHEGTTFTVRFPLCEKPE